MRMHVRWDGVRPGRLAQVFKKVGKDSDMTLRRAAYEISRSLEREVRQLYYYYASHKTPGPVQQMLARAGKDVGAEAPPRTPSDGSISTMAEIGRNIVTLPTADANKYYVVRISPDAVSSQSNSRYPFGQPLWLLGEVIEKNISTIWPITLRMLGYLYTVRRGKGGFGTRKRSFHMPNQRATGLGVMTIAPPNMPVWSVAASRLKSMLPHLKGRVHKMIADAIKQYG